MKPTNIIEDTCTRTSKLSCVQKIARQGQTIFGRSSLPLLSLHCWIGTAAAVWSLGIVWLSERDDNHGKRSQALRVALWTGSALIGMTAHFRGSLVHGEDFFVR